MPAPSTELTPGAELYVWGSPLLTVLRTKAIQCSSEAGRTPMAEIDGDPIIT